MLKSPPNLQDLCLNTVCNNINNLCEEKDSFGSSCLTFKFYDGFLHRNVSQMLLEKLSLKRCINDKTLSLFAADKTRLERIKINHGERISKKGLKYLKNHKISELEITDLSFSITVNDLIGCMGEWTLQNLNHLNVSNNRFTNNSKFCVVVSLSKLKNLKTLIVQNTEFNDHGLEIVAEDLPFLEYLDISSTRVSDISPLEICKNKLKTLKMYDLKVKESDSFIPLICSMPKLQHLDISYDRDQLFQILISNHFNISKLLESYDALPNLVSLDISGKDRIDIGTLKEFLQAHPKLQFLGLVETDACQESIFASKQPPDSIAQLYITGNANESQIVNALKYYTRRINFIQKSLYHLYNLTHDYTVIRMDIIELILPAMERYPAALGIQMAGTACLYNLTKGGKSHKIHKCCLESAVNLTLLAMQNFPKHQQIQKNGLLTLCSDLILQDVNFDKYLCARLVMDSLVLFDDVVMNKMSVAICSILAAKISTKDTSVLGNLYMDRLLSIVKGKMEDFHVDTMLKFTLSALWNLTDESPLTCSVFLKKGGLDIFLQVLENAFCLRAIPGEYAIETKVLGLLNNIAEVDNLRADLLSERCLTHIRNLLHSKSLDVSYFAAGILAHLCSDLTLDWEGLSETYSKALLLEALGKVVEAWEFPDSEMVTYRSFKPFYPLLSCQDAQEVQQWALWAIYHVCSKNPARYINMLSEEGFLNHITTLASDENNLPLVIKLSSHILSFIPQ